MEMEELQNLGVRWSLIMGIEGTVSGVRQECRQDNKGLCWRLQGQQVEIIGQGGKDESKTAWSLRAERK